MLSASPTSSVPLMQEQEMLLFCYATLAFIVVDSFHVSLSTRLLFAILLKVDRCRWLWYFHPSSCRVKLCLPSGTSSTQSIVPHCIRKGSCALLLRR